MTESEKKSARLERERRRKLKLKRPKPKPTSAISDNDTKPINPNQFYRKSVARKFFGYGTTMFEEKIKSGELPMPFSLSEDGRACGYFGQTIIDHQNEIREKGQLIYRRKMEERQQAREAEMERIYSKKKRSA